MSKRTHTTISISRKDKDRVLGIQERLEALTGEPWTLGRIVNKGILLVEKALLNKEKKNA